MNQQNVVLTVISLALGLSVLMLVYGIIVERRSRKELEKINRLLAEISAWIKTDMQGKQ